MNIFNPDYRTPDDGLEEKKQLIKAAKNLVTADDIQDLVGDLMSPEEVEDFLDELGIK